MLHGHFRLGRDLSGGEDDGGLDRNVTAAQTLQRASTGFDQTDWT